MRENLAMKFKRLYFKGFILVLLLFLCVHYISGNGYTDTLIRPTKSIKVTELPDDAAIIFWSSRNTENPLGQSHLYTMNINGTNITQITFDTYQYEHAAVSYDHRYIAANHYPVRKGDAAISIWIIDLKNKTEAQLVPEFHQAGSGGIDWSPDGFIYFAGQPVKGKARNIYKIKPDGSEFKQLTYLVQNPNSTPPDPAIVSDVSVSENGSMIAYLRGVAQRKGRDWVGKPQIWVMNSDGSNQRVVYNGGEKSGMYGYDAIGAYDPEISPDGRKIIFSQTDTNFRVFPSLVNTAHNLWVINLDGTGKSRLTQPGHVSIIPDWHNDKILYTEYSEKDRYTGLVLMNPDGTGKKRLEMNLELWRGGRHGKFIPSR